MAANKYKVHTVVNKPVDFGQINSNLKKETYKYLGAGSGRVVFDLENGNVVKFAKNKRGLAQNKAEYKIASESSSRLLAKISDISGESDLLIMEKAEKIPDISFVWNFFNVKSNSELYRVKELQDICKKHHLKVRDFGRAANWGKIDGKPIIIDYGFTQQVCRRFYMSLAARIMNK